MDHSVDHSVLERARQQNIAEDPRVYQAIPFLVSLFLVELGALVRFARDDLSRAEERVEALESCGYAPRQIRQANGSILDILRAGFQSCAEELGVLCGQVCVDIEFGGGSVTTDPDNDDILPVTARDTIVRIRNMREGMRWLTYLGLFLRSRRVRMASDMTIFVVGVVCVNNGMVANKE